MITNYNAVSLSNYQIKIHINGFSYQINFRLDFMQYQHFVLNIKYYKTGVEFFLDAP